MSNIERAPEPGSLSEISGTEELFSLDQEVLGELLQGEVLYSSDGNKAVRMTDIEPFSKDGISRNFRAIHGMSPGDFWPQRYRSSVISHIVTRDKNTGESGACLRIKGAELLEDAGFREARNQSEVASYLGFEGNTEGRVVLQDGKLYVLKGSEGIHEPESVGNQMSPEEAMGRILGE